MKRIILPEPLTKAIEEKLAAEQEAQRITFVLAKEKANNQRQ